MTSPTESAAYSIERDETVVRLRDHARQLVLTIAPGAGNMACSCMVHGHEILRFPFRTPEEFLASGSGLQGIPLLAPWANRLDEPAFYANGQRFAFDLELGNVSGPVPIHGFLSRASDWTITRTTADATHASMTSRLDVFANPLWMKQFPFAHRIGMTYTVAAGVVEIETTIENLSAARMPVSIGFHPYFTLTDSHRDEWTIGIGARSEWLLDERKLPTGARRPIESRFPTPGAVALADVDLDHVFGDLVTDAEGRSTMTVRGRSQRLDVIAGRRYGTSVIYAPRRPPRDERNFICIEPMAAITNAMNLAHRGQYDQLQSIAPGGTWQERFWIRPSGFERLPLSE